MIYLLLGIVIVGLAFWVAGLQGEAAAYEATIDDLRRDADQLLDLYYNCQAENEQLRARIAELEATPDYLAKENDE